MRIARWLLLTIGLGWAAGAEALGLDARVLDRGGRPVPNTVVTLLPASGSPPAPTAGLTATMDQRNRQFDPFVLAVERGTAISFPNSDQIRHHVYSFSEPKRFELRLYKGKPAEPIVFDRPGTVVLGCNIHDSMIAYVRVVDSPWFAVTNAEGIARIEGVPAGAYRAALWQPAIEGRPSPAPVDVTLPRSEPLALTLDVDDVPPAPGPHTGGEAHERTHVP